MLFEKLLKPKSEFEIKDSRHAPLTKVHAFIAIAIGLFLSLKEGFLSHHMTISNALVNVTLVYGLAYFFIFKTKKSKPALSNVNYIDDDSETTKSAMTAFDGVKFQTAKITSFRPLPSTQTKPTETPDMASVVRTRKLPVDGRVKPGWFS